MTIAEALRDAAVRLERVGGTGRLDAAFILAHTGGVSRAEMLAHGDRALADDVAARFESAVARREAGEPLPYITGEAGFYGRMFNVDRRVLVPRPETELAIEWAVRHLDAIGRTAGRALDVGTGSGAIAVTLACELPDLNVAATDIDQGALAVARRNAARNNVFQHVTFLRGDLAEPARRFGPFDAIVANLPYVPSSECAAAPDPVSFEPMLARDGGADGLELYRRLVPALRDLIAPRGIIILEAAAVNVRELANLVGSAVPGAGTEVVQDYSGIERFVIAAVPA